MKQLVSIQMSKCFRRVVIAIVAIGIAAQVGYARSSNNLIVVPPTHLPELARQSGQAMLLHETIDGATHLYIEQDQGARLVILDVTDPAHATSIRSEGRTSPRGPRMLRPSPVTT